MTRIARHDDVPFGVPPAVHPETREFWAALAAADFRLPQCCACKTIRFPISSICPACLATCSRLADVDVQGTVAVSVEIQRATRAGAWQELVPYQVGLVELDDGIRIPGRIFCDCDAGCRQGDRAEVGRIPTAEPGLYVWAFFHSCRSRSEPQQVGDDVR